MSDPLAAWPTFALTDKLGEDHDLRPGFITPEIRVDPRGPLLAVAGGWAQSTHLGASGPGVVLRLALRAAGHPDHHKIEAVLLAEIASELGVILYAAAQRAPIDEAAAQLWDQL